MGEIDIGYIFVSTNTRERFLRGGLGVMEKMDIYWEVLGRFFFGSGFGFEFWRRRES